MQRTSDFDSQSIKEEIKEEDDEVIEQIIERSKKGIVMIEDEEEDLQEASKQSMEESQRKPRDRSNGEGSSGKSSRRGR